MEARHAIVTGAGSGIGRACALRLAADGFVLHLVGRRAEKLEEVAEEIRAQTGNEESAAIAPLDVAEPGAMEAAVSELTGDGGGVDVLVANAGINPQRAPAHETDDEHWAETLRVNLTGVHRSCQAVLPSMMERRRGAIVTVGSVAGQVGMAARAAYGPSKAAVIEYTRNLAVDYASFGIRANCVCPAFVVTDINRDWLENLPGEQYEALVARHPLGLGEPADVAAAVAFLAGDGARWITGVDLSVDGGYTAH